MATQTETIVVNGAEIQFYPTSHRYKVDGTWVSSVTTVLDLIDKSRALLKWSENLAREYLFGHLGQILLADVIENAVTQYTQKRDEAADIGTEVHNWIKQFIYAKKNNTQIPEVLPNMDDRVVNGIMAFISWYNVNQIEFLESERITYSKEYNYIGTFDALINLNGVITLADYKSGKGIYPKFWYQLAAYKQAYNEEFPNLDIQDLMILHCDKETGDFKTYTKKSVDISVEHFNNLLKLKLDLARLERKS